MKTVRNFNLNTFNIQIINLVKQHPLFIALLSLLEDLYCSSIQDDTWSVSFPTICFSLTVSSSFKTP